MTRSLINMTIKNIENFIGSYNRPDNPTSCWRWRKGLNKFGYGKYNLYNTEMIRQDNRAAHRVCYELFKGVIPDGLVLDHLCRNRWCVNPSHLEPVTQSENVRRGIVARAGI